MDVFLMIRRKKLTIFTDCKDTTTVLELKGIISGITKNQVENIMLVKDGITMDDFAPLQKYGLSTSTAKAQSPAAITMILRADASSPFETPDVTPYSAPPELPDVMKAQENATAEGAAA